MDSALQRRSKLRATASTGAGGAPAMSDSDKISLQLLLDVRAYAAEVCGLICVGVGVCANLCLCVFVCLGVGECVDVGVFVFVLDGCWCLCV